LAAGIKNRRTFPQGKWAIVPGIVMTEPNQGREWREWMEKVFFAHPNFDPTRSSASPLAWVVT
jgi:hypothetical protein